MSKAKLAAAGLAAVPVSAEWSAELSGFRDTVHGRRNTEYCINIMYTIDTIQYNTMAKHVTRRSYKNRASKKRRTIRKLKKTMRRKIQRGGLGEDVIIQIMLQLAPQVIPVILSLINLGNVELLISIIKLLSGSQSRPVGRAFSVGGSKSNNRQLQRGGGLKKTVLIKLDELADKFKDKPDVVACIKIIKARIEKEPEPAAAAPAAVDSSTELESLTTELTTDTNITDADKAAADTVVMETGDPALTAALEAEPNAKNTPVVARLPPAVEKAAEMSIIHKMITFFNERIKSNITAKLDGMISDLKDKVGEDVIDCIRTLKTTIVEDIVTQIKNNVSSITTEILNKIFRVGGVIASDIITFLLWSSVQIAMKNYSAIPKEGGKLLLKRGIQVVGAVVENGRGMLNAATEQGRNAYNTAVEAETRMLQGFGDKSRELLNDGRDRASRMIDNIRQSRGNTSRPELQNSESQSLSLSESQSKLPPAQQKPGLLGRIGSGIGSVFGSK